MSHIAVERNRRRQMNDHLKVLRSLTPAFYIKRGDQASIIGGAIDFIKELQTLLQSLEAQKKRRQQPQAHLISPASASGGSFSPSPTPSPRSLITSCSPTATAACFSSSSSSAGSSSSISPKDNKPPPPQSQQLVAELAACCNSPMADVEARISGANVLLRTLSRRGPPAVRIIALLESLHLEVLHLNITTMDDTVLYSFVLNIGLDCHLSVDDLAMEVHQTFCCIMPPPPAAHPDHHLDS